MKQLQEENLKIHKYVAIKHHAPEQPMGQRKESQEKLENILRQMNVKEEHTKNYEMKQKQYQEGNLYQ